MIKKIKKFLLPYIAPLYYYSAYLKLIKEIDCCFENPYDVFCFFPAYHIGGGEKVHVQILKALSGYKIATFITYKSRSSALLEDFKKDSNSFIDIGATGNYIFFQKKLAVYLSKKFNTINFTCTLFGCNSDLFYQQLPLIKNEKIKKTDLLHAFAPYINGIEKTSIHYVPFIDNRIVINKKTAEDYQVQYKANAIEDHFLNRIQIIYNALDESCEKMGKVFLFPLKCLFVGRNSPEKRFYLFSAIATGCRKLQLPLTFSVVGDLEMFKPENPGVEFLGEINDIRILNTIYQEHHLLLTTSIYEGFPLTMMEAMCNGLVTISTAVGGIPEHIQQGKNGFLINDDINEKKIINDFIQLLTRLSTDLMHLPELSDNSIRYARDNFSYGIFKKKYIEVLINIK